MRFALYLAVAVLCVSLDPSVGELRGSLPNVTAGSSFEDEASGLADGMMPNVHAERRLSANGVQITWYTRHTNPATAAVWQTWATEKAFCERQGKRLCSYRELCPSGVGHPPSGFSANNDRWVATSISDTCPNNGWVQIGPHGGNNGNRCKRHEAWGHCPSWGLTHNAGTAYYFENIPCCNIGSSNNAPCLRPSGWCGHHGSVYKSADCDGDGIADHSCIDRNGNRGALLSSRNCASTWPNDPQDSCPPAYGTCERPAGWCTGSLDKYNYVDCDGDGLPDHTCYNIHGSRGTILTGSNCAHTWPSAAENTCPAVFGNCARGQWCYHSGATYYYWDCSGNGQAQHACSERHALFGHLVGSKGFMYDGNCGTNWPNAFIGQCPGAF